jgi:hypothetical protein
VNAQGKLVMPVKTSAMWEFEVRHARMYLADIQELIYKIIMPFKLDPR